MLIKKERRKERGKKEARIPQYKKDKERLRI